MGPGPGHLGKLFSARRRRRRRRRPPSPGGDLPQEGGICKNEIHLLRTWPINQGSGPISSDPSRRLIIETQLAAL